MQKKILEFTNILRKSGIRVSTAEGIDAFSALDELPLQDREIFKDALRATMVKRGEEVATYDQLFDLFWSGFYDSLRENFEQASGGLPEGMDLEQLLQYTTGPFFYIMAIVSAIHGFEVVDLGSSGWNWISTITITGGIMLTYIPEMTLGRYRNSS